MLPLLPWLAMQRALQRMKGNTNKADAAIKIKVLNAYCDKTYRGCFCAEHINIETIETPKNF